LQELEAVFHAMADGVVVFDAQGGVVLVNEAEARICGFSSTAEMMRDLPFFTTIYELFSEDDDSVIPVAQWPVSRVLRGETVADVKIRARRTDTGQSWHLRFDGSPVLGPDGAVRLAVVITRDVTEQVEAEAALRASEDRFRAMFSSIDEGFCVIEMIFDDAGEPVDYRFLEVNEAFRRQTGLVDAVGRTALELVPNLDPSWFRIYGGVARTGEPVRVENYSPAMGRWYDAYAARFGDPSARRVAVLFKDITERKQAEEALKESERRAREAAAEAQRERQMMDAVLHAAAVGIIVADANGRLLRINPGNERLWGPAPYSEDVGAYGEWKGWWADGSERHGQRIAGEEWAMARALRGETVEGDLVQIEPFDRPGARRTLVISGAPVRGESGEILGAVVVQADITRIVAAEAAVRKSEEQYRLVSRATNEVLWDWEIATGRLDWNEAARAQLGVTRDDVTMSSWSERIHPDDRERVLSGFDAALGSEAEGWRDEYRMRRADGSYGVFVDRGYIARAADGRPTRMIGSMLDITDRRDLEQRVAQAQRLESLGRFAGGIAHDFNNLLTAVLGYAEVLERKLDGTAARAHATRIREASERGSELTRQILAFARPQVGRLRVVDLDRIVLSADPILRRLLGSDVELVTVPAGQPSRVRMDPSQVEQVLFNLVVNARDAMPEGGRIAIETANVDIPAHSEAPLRAGRWARLSVTDDGDGMDAETLAHCFEPFFTTKEPDKGTGLGLATVWGIVDHAGGFIRVDSAPGRGTRFEVHFPPDASPAAADADDPAPAQEVRGGTETVLVVEDEPTLRELTRSTLEALGYRVLVAGHGHEALAAVETLDGPLHAVVTDVVMPLMNGRELARRLRERLPDVSVLFVSGYTDQPVGDKDTFLAKPFAPSALAARLRTLLDG
jgi:PAS domain S-box-containing protein